MLTFVFRLISRVVWVGAQPWLLSSVQQQLRGLVTRAPGRAVLRVAAPFAQRPPRRPTVLRAVRAVRPRVLVQVVRAHEALVAHGALEALLPRVRAQMPLQLVGAREALPAEQPVADERPLAGVPAQVRLQMRRLAVHLPAARYVAAVQASPAWTRSARPEPLGLLAVGTVACGFPGVATRGGPRGGGQREHRVLGQRGGADTVGV